MRPCAKCAVRKNGGITGGHRGIDNAKPRYGSLSLPLSSALSYARHFDFEGILFSLPRGGEERGTRSDSHEGQDEIKERRCRSRDNDPVSGRRGRSEDRTSIECLDKTSRLIGCEEAGGRGGERRVLSSPPLPPRDPPFSALMLSRPLNPRVLFSTAACTSRIRTRTCALYSRGETQKKKINHRCIAINAIASRTCRRPSRV